MKKVVIISFFIFVAVVGTAGLYFKFKPKTQEFISSNYNYEEDAENEGNVPIKKLEDIKVPNTPANMLCKKLPLLGQENYGERYRCLAIVNRDERFCEGLDEEKENNICLALVKKDPSYCEKVTSPDAKHVCYYQLAVTSENANFCSEINYSQHEKEQCYMNFVTNLYFWGKPNEIKKEYCDQLGIPDKYTCQALQTNNVSLCGNNPHCLTFFKQELSFCDGVGNQLEDCIRDRAMTNKDVSICERLDGEKRDDCLGDFCTHIDLDAGTCDLVDDAQMRQERYVELAVKLANGD